MELNLKIAISSAISCSEERSTGDARLFSTRTCEAFHTRLELKKLETQEDSLRASTELHCFKLGTTRIFIALQVQALVIVYQQQSTLP